METGIIRYNLKNRGRKYVGNDRNFDIEPLMQFINGPQCQESVKNHDMIGFYGHWPRIRYGLRPQEGGPSEKGKAEIVEPAFVTTFLKGYQDGTIEHKARFLDTDAGKLASKLFSERVGGFSSCIVERTHTFYGFDYVLEPNYTTNRGYVLDNVGPIFDDVTSSGMTTKEIEKQIFKEQIRGIQAILDASKNERSRTAEVIDHLREENNELINLCLAKGINVEQELDSARVGFFRPSFKKDRIMRKIAVFDAAELNFPSDRDISENQPVQEFDDVTSRLFRRMR